MEIKVLGPGCANCHKMHDMANKAVAELGVEAKVDYITDIVEIMKYVTSTPGLVVDGKVKHAGKPLPSQDKVKSLIQEEIQ
jgi:small redox-active disulfide protein 2